MLCFRALDAGLVELVCYCRGLTEDGKPIRKEGPMPKLADLPRVQRIRDESREKVREVLKASQEAVRDAVQKREANQEKELHSFSFRF